MAYYRHIYRNAPTTVTLPPELHDRRVEVIVLPLDEPSASERQPTADALGWPVGFFDETFGSLLDHPQRAQPEQYDIREPIE